MIGGGKAGRVRGKMRRLSYPPGIRLVRNPLFALIAVAATGALAGCSNSHLLPDKVPFVYRIDIQQGNVITQNMLARLKPGMDKAKVRYIMGTPLIIDTFHDNRWDYVYTFQKNGGERVERHVTLYFKDGKLAYVTGNVKTAPGALKPKPRPEETIEITKKHEEGLVTRMLHDVGLGKKEAEADKKQKAAAKAAKQEALAKTKEADAAQTADKKKGFFGRLLQKIGLGKDAGDSGDYSPGNPKYRDPTNPDQSQVPGP